MAEQEPRPKHETRDVPVRPFMIFMAVMIVGAIVMHVLLGVLSWVFRDVNARIQGPQPPVAFGVAEPPTPPLLLSDELLNQLHRHEKEELAAFKWADPKKEFVDIPIDRAMQIVAERGLPDWRNETDFRYW